CRRFTCSRADRRFASQFDTHASEPQLWQFQLSRKEVDRKSTRLNSSHLGISYAVFCLKKKKKNRTLESVITSREAEPSPPDPLRDPTRFSPTPRSASCTYYSPVARRYPTLCSTTPLLR